MSSSKKLLQAAAGNAGESLYVEDVFSTYLYTGTGSPNVINNGIDLAGEGGFLWIKQRTGNEGHNNYDTLRGVNKALHTDSTSAEQNYVGALTSFNSNGFTVDQGGYAVNNNGITYASWSFRKAEKFFDVVTYTGNSTVGRTVAHNLGVAPAWMVIKCTNAARNWCTYHISLGNGYQIILNNGVAKESTALWNSTTPTATEFTLGNDADVNGTGNTYIAYLFASDAGGYGDDGSENIIKCGSVTTDGSGNASVDLGFEPQWCLWKCADAAVGNEHGNWRVNDVMRGWPVPDASNAFGYPSTLYANTIGAETISGVDGFIKSATGFGFGQVQANTTYIYVAIRRPMKTPESGTEVFTPNAYTGDGATRVLTSSNDPVDLGIVRGRGGSADWIWSDRLRGATKTLYSNYTQAEDTQSTYITGFDVQDGMEVGTGTAVNGSGSTYISYMLSRATGFFDVVAYTGDGSGAKSFNHNLGVIPELMIVKGRNYADSWYVYVGSLGSSNRLKLESTTASGSAGTLWNSTSPTATQFTVGSGLNASSETNIVYLFATLAGVSKVGSYTGTGSDQNIDCGFSGSPRFLMIKRTDSAGDWYVWDSARGIVAGNDPRLQINSGSGGETTSQDWIDPYASGFTLVGGNQPNISGGTYIFLAIA